jgi:hypothetical protein
MRIRRSRRRHTIAALLAGLLICAVLVQGAPAAAADTSPPTTPTNLHVTSQSSTAISLAWNASTDDVAVAAYIVRRDGAALAVVKGNPPMTSYTDAAVQAGQTYRYRVRARDAAGNRSSFSNSITATAGSTGTTVTVAAGGDVACDPDDPNYRNGVGTATACRQQYTSDLLVNGGYDAVLALGDLQYNSGSLSDFNAVYDPTWGRVKSITYPVVGNHEYGQSGASGYFDYFGSRAGARGKGYYSFNLGAWHIIAINSNCGEVSCSANSPQEQWLRADLAAHPADCTLAMWHHARWSSGHDGDNTFMQAMWADLVAADAEIVLSGHSHDYERFAPQDANGNLDASSGVRQFVVGTGGAFFTGFGSTIDPNSQTHQNNTFGVLKLTLRPDAYDWRFVPEAGKSYSDSGTTACH